MRGRQPESRYPSQFPSSQSLAQKKSGSGTYPLVVDDLDDGGQATGGGAAALDEDNTANLNQAPVGCNDRCLGHCVWSICAEKSGLAVVVESWEMKERIV